MIQTMPKGGPRLGVVRHPLKLTSLLYLKDALREERYEICADIIALAKEFGATASEVQRLLEDPRRSPG